MALVGVHVEAEVQETTKASDYATTMRPHQRRLLLLNCLELPYRHPGHLRQTHPQVMHVASLAPG